MMTKQSFGFSECANGLDLDFLFPKCDRQCQNNGTCFFDLFFKKQCECSYCFSGDLCEVRMFQVFVQLHFDSDYH